MPLEEQGFALTQDEVDEVLRVMGTIQERPPIEEDPSTPSSGRVRPTRFLGTPGRIIHDQPRQYQIKQIWDNHREIIRALAAGEKPISIARRLGLSRATVTNVSRSNITRQRIDELHRAMDGEVIDVGNRIKAFAPIALKIQEEIAMDESVSPAVRVAVTNELLNRAGYQPPKQVNIDARFGLSPDTLTEVKNRARLIRSETQSSDIEDVPFQVVPQLS